MSDSPFVVGPPLKADQPIFGRDDTLHFIGNELKHFRSVNLVGERRMGKTSVINHLLGHQEEYLPSPENEPQLVLAPVDLQANMTDANRFYGVALREILARSPETNAAAPELLAGPWMDLSQGPNATYHQFEHVLQRLHDADDPQVRPVVLVEEFERLLREDANEGFPYPDFFEGLRALMTRNLLAFVVTSRLSLTEHFNAHPESMTSTLHTYFQVHELGLLDDSDADALLLQPSDHPLTPQEAREARKWAKGHPCRLQAAGAAWYDAKRQGEAKRWAKKRYQERVNDNCAARPYAEKERRAERHKKNTRLAMAVTLAVVALLMIAGWIWGERIPLLGTALWTVPISIGRQVQRLGTQLDEFAAWLMGWTLILVILLAIFGTISGADVVAVLKKALGID